MIVHEFFRTLPLIIIIIATFCTILFKSLFALWLLVGLFVNGFIWGVVNPIVKKEYPDIAKRPSTKSCYYLEDNKQVNAGGMPSGHCQSMAFFCTFLLLYVIEKYPLDTPLLWTTTIAASVGTFYMMYSRAHYYKCHTWMQASAGSAIGIVTALIMFAIDSKTFMMT